MGLHPQKSRFRYRIRAVCVMHISLQSMFFHFIIPRQCDALMYEGRLLLG